MRNQRAMAASTASLPFPRAPSTGPDGSPWLELPWLLLVCSRKDFGLKWEGELKHKLRWLFPGRGQ